MKTIKTSSLPQKQLKDFFEVHWGSPEMVISSGIYDCSKLDGFAFLNQDSQIIGLITYVIANEHCEIISLDSLDEGKGIGTALIKQVEEYAKKKKCRFIKLVTTNDNLQALKFYQKRGYEIVAVHKNAVEEARKIKPEIPLLGHDDIPIRDEIELEKRLT